MDPVEPRRDLRWSHEDENYSILEKWCGDVIYREKDVDDLPLHRLRRTAIDLLRWNPGVYSPGEFYPYLPLDDEVDEPAPAPAVADPEEDAELICRPRTIGGIPQTRE